MNTLVLEPDPASRMRLRSLLNSTGADLVVLAETTSIAQAKQVMLHSNIDVLIASVDTEGDIFELAHRHGCVLVCLARDADQAVRAFESGAVHYVMKPLSESSIAIACSRARSRLVRYRSTPSALSISEPQTAFSTGVIALPVFDGFEMRHSENIVRVEAEGNYCRVVMAKDPSILLSRTIGDFEDAVSANGFIRVHRSSIVNMEHVRRFIRGKSPLLIMSNGDRVDVSARCKEAVLKAVMMPRRRH